MGTYIYIYGDLDIKEENVDKAVQAVRDLNKRDDLKRGGGKNSCWFSWIDENYESKIHSIEDILGELLGFSYSKALKTDCISYSFNYNDKWGQHELFFIAMAPYLESMTIDHLCDELDYEDQKWRIELDKKTKKVHMLQPKVTVEYPEISDDNEVGLEFFSPNFDI